MTVDNAQSLTAAEPLDDDDLAAIEQRWQLTDERHRTRSQVDLDLYRLVTDVRRLRSEREHLVEEVAHYRASVCHRAGHAVTGDRCGPGAFRPPGGGDSPEAA